VCNNDAGMGSLPGGSLLYGVSIVCAFAALRLKKLGLYTFNVHVIIKGRSWPGVRWSGPSANVTRVSCKIFINPFRKFSGSGCRHRLLWFHAIFVMKNT